MGEASSEYGYTRELKGVRYEDAVQRVTEALKTEGFGVLSTIDVKETLKKKIGAEFRKYVILGACNPQLAHRALSADVSIGLLLPCNVVVFEGEGGSSVVQVVKPDAMLSVARGTTGVEAVAREADEKLRRALEKV